MATSLGGWFDKVFFDAHGEPCASGELRFYQTGTDIPQGVATFDGTPLGSVIRLDDDGRPESDFRFYTDKIYRVVVVDADGVVVKTIDGVAIPEGEGGAMYNPMTAEGDIIVGGTGGEPSRLGVGADGDILATASGAPTWEGGPKKYRNVYQNIPSPQINDGYLGCLFYMTGGGAQTIDLPSAVSIPNKSFIDFVFLDDTTTLTITPQGGSVLNTQATAVTVGGKSATLYRLTFLGRGDIGGVPTDQWAVGGSVLPDGKVIAATGDATRGTLNAKINPESPLTKEVETDIHGVKTLKLALELGNDEEVLTTEEDGLGNKSANWKLPSGKLKVTSADTALDYLANKLVQGTGITLTPQTDGDGVQTLEVSATGGGGGGGPTRWENGCLCETYTVDSSANDSTRLAFAWTYSGLPLAKVKSMTVFMNYSSKAPVFFEGAIYRRALSGWVNGNDFARGSRVAYKNATGSAWSGSSFQTLTFDDAVAIEDGYSYTFVLNLGRSQNSSYFDLGIIQEGRPSTNVTGGYCRGISVSLGASLTLSTANGWYANEGGTRYYWLKLASE